jgi:hypothetical protein
MTIGTPSICTINSEYNYEFFENECADCVVEYSTYLVAIKAGFSEVITHTPPTITSPPVHSCLRAAKSASPMGMHLESKLIEVPLFRTYKHPQIDKLPHSPACLPACDGFPIFLLTCNDPPTCLLTCNDPPPVCSPAAAPPSAYSHLQATSFTISTLGLILAAASTFGAFVASKRAAAMGRRIEAQLIVADLAPLSWARRHPQLQQPIGDQPSQASDDPQSGEASSGGDLGAVTTCIKK